MQQYTAENLGHFLDLISVAGIEVIVPEGTEWDYSDLPAYQKITRQVNVKCAKITGNGAIIKNISAQAYDTCFSFCDYCYVSGLKMYGDFYATYSGNPRVASFWNEGDGEFSRGSNDTILQQEGLTAQIKISECIFDLTIYSAGHSDMNCLYSSTPASYNLGGIRMERCAARLRMPSGGVIGYSSSAQRLRSSKNRFDITTTSETAPTYDGYNVFVQSYYQSSAGATGTTYNNEVLNTEIVLHAPNVEYLELTHQKATSQTWERYATYRNCVIRGELANGAAISKVSEPDYLPPNQTSGCVLCFAATFEETRTDRGVLATPTEIVNEILLKDVVAPDPTYAYRGYNFRLIALDESWHTGSSSDQEDPNYTTWWRTGNPLINNSLPYQPDMLDLPTTEMPDAVPQLPYITIHDILTPQAELEYANTNGLAILTPTSCEVTEELNGAWTFSMTHPIDPEGKWEKIKLRNLVKINGQYFTILNVVNVYENGSGYIQCSGEHIFYQQNDSWIFPGDPIVGVSGADYITKMNGRTETYGTELASLVYYFYGSSDITGTVSKETEEGCTPIDALIGSGGLIDQSGTGGAELYRDNFRYSINTRMENAIDDAFDIRIGRDLSAITRNFDTSQFVSYFRAYGEAGWWAVAWKLTDFLSRSFPHHIIRSKNFDIPAGDNFWDLLISQGMAFFRRNGKPIVGWDITLEDVRNNPDFEIVMHDQNNPWRLKVGDSGSVYDERLGGKLTGLKISGTVYDAVRDKIIKITIGDQQHFSAPSASAVTVEPEIVAGEIWIRDADGAYILDADGKKIMQEVVTSG